MSFKKNFTVAKKSVFYNFKRYLCFFVMLFVIQTLFASVIILYDNNNHNQVEYLEGNYNYHLQIQNLNDTQYYYLVNFREAENQETFQIISGTKSQIAGTTRVRYDLNIKFYEDVNSNYKKFTATHYEALYEEGNFKEFQTPLLKYELDLAKNTVICALTCLFIFISGCVIIYLIDSIMVNHYKFSYGIYMTFGANFKKLFANSLYEMLLISVMVFLPSQVISNLVCFIILKSNTLAFRISIASILLSLVMCIAVAAIPVFLNVKTISRKTPLKLISAVDNSNHITSPRISSDFIGYTFPKSTELLSLKRFRKYILRLVLSTVTFAVAFVCCAYLGSSYGKTLDIKEPQFNIFFNSYKTVIENDTEDESTENDENDEDDSSEENEGSDGSSSEDSKQDSDSVEDEIKNIVDDDDRVTIIEYYPYSYDAEASEYLYSFNGIEMIIKNCSTAALDIDSHLKLSKENVKLFGGAENADSDRCFLNTDFTVLDSEVASIIDYYGYKVEGDLSDVITNSDMIAITDGYNNSTRFDLSVGDKVYIATKANYVKNMPPFMSGDLDYIMAMKLTCCEYTYKEFTVGAIIKDAPVGESFPVYMNGDTYKRITGNDVIFNDIDIIMDSDITEKEYEELLFNLRHAMDYYSNANLTNNDAKVLGEIERNKRYESVYLFIAIMLLTVSPIIWMFSQILFYLKRRPEFDVYFSLGASTDAIKKAFVIDGIVFSVIGALSYVVLTIIASLGVTVFLNSQFFDASEFIKFSYSIPIIPFIIGLAITVISAFLSTYVPYIIYIRSCHEIFTGRVSQMKQDVISEGETGV